MIILRWNIVSAMCALSLHSFVDGLPKERAIILSTKLAVAKKLPAALGQWFPVICP